MADSFLYENCLRAHDDNISLPLPLSASVCMSVPTNSENQYVYKIHWQQIDNAHAMVGYECRINQHLQYNSIWLFFILIYLLLYFSLNSLLLALF